MNPSQAAYSAACFIFVSLEFRYRNSDIETKGTMKALTIKEPFATLCVSSSYDNVAIPIKACEIRAWRWPYTFPFTIAVHSSSDQRTIGHDIDHLMAKNWDTYWAFDNPDAKAGVPGMDLFYASTFVGFVDVVGCMEIDPKWRKKEKLTRIVDAGFDPYYAKWAKPPYSFMLANPRRLTQGIHCPGKLKVWEVPADIAARLESTECFAQSHSKVYASEEEPRQCLELPLKPVGVAKCLGKPNYADLTRKAKEKLR